MARLKMAAIPIMIIWIWRTLTRFYRLATHLAANSVQISQIAVGSRRFY